MHYTKIFGLIAGILSILAYIPYISSILKGSTKPNRASWLIWLVMNIIILASYHSSGAESTIFVLVSYSIGTIIVALLSLKYGEGGWTSFDRTCLIISAVGLLLWFIFNSPLPALLINIAVDMTGALPTIRKVYCNPQIESKSAWLLFFAGSIANLVAIDKFEFAIVVYPVAMFLIIGAVFFLVFRTYFKSNF